MSALFWWQHPRYLIDVRGPKKGLAGDRRAQSSLCLLPFVVCILEKERVWLLGPRPSAVHFSGPRPHLTPHQVSLSCPMIFFVPLPRPHLSFSSPCAKVRSCLFSCLGPVPNQWRVPQSQRRRTSSACVNTAHTL